MTDPQRRLLAYLSLHPHDWHSMHHLDFQEGALVPMDAVVLVPDLVAAKWVEYQGKDRGVRITSMGLAALTKEESQR